MGGRGTSVASPGVEMYVEEKGHGEEEEEKGEETISACRERRPSGRFAQQAGMPSSC